MRRILALAALAATGPALAQQQGAPFVIEGTDKGFASLQDAVNEIWAGEGTILIAPGVYRQCAIQAGGRIAFKAVEPGTAIFEATPCEGKAMLVLRGRESIVDGLVFRGVRVPDGNGAGIRTEMGNLTVVNSTFLDSQEGILGGEPTNQKIVIDRSTFAGLGQCDETTDCAHSIYLSNNGSVTVTRSRFERGRGGHYVKVRTPRAEILDSSFDDSEGNKTNYAIDLPEGSTGLIARNTFVQGTNKENHTAVIAVAAENRSFPSRGLRVEDNVSTLAPGAKPGVAFVADWSGEALNIGANRLGPGITPFSRR